ncbi:hypothetical protein GCM10008961_10090 [Deinococcus knuensis]|uniref:Uncharacterized protein n=1 Tax=Deinococcus knuensis TaxID=1837380 RepID=A0ABQ2SFD4_9DEIO|nr:hypothetical protein GCM10008961_10090 [Deinococcus knuensis]
MPFQPVARLQRGQGLRLGADPQVVAGDLPLRAGVVQAFQGRQFAEDLHALQSGLLAQFAVQGVQVGFAAFQTTLGQLRVGAGFHDHRDLPAAGRTFQCGDVRSGGTQDDPAHAGARRHTVRAGVVGGVRGWQWAVGTHTDSD